MKIAVVLNGISLSKDLFYKKYLPVVRAEFEVDVFETRSINDGISIAERLTAKRYDVIVAAGGDGTVNQVVNGMLSDPGGSSRRPTLAILPLGSGNDFARTLAQGSTPGEFLNRLKSGCTKDIDVGEIIFSVSPPGEKTTSIQNKRYFINVADVGMGPTVVRGVLDSGRALGSAFAYYKSILRTFFTYKPLLLRALGDEWEWKGLMRTFAIGNAKYYGNGLCIAPDAILDDGIFEVFAAGRVSVIDFIVQSIPLKKGLHVKHPEVRYLRSKRIELSSDVAVEIEADGEIIGWLPATVSFSTERLPILWDK